MALRPQGPDRPSSSGGGRLGLLMAVAVLALIAALLVGGILASR